MSLAQLSSDLSQKDSEKTSIQEEIKKLEEVAFQGFKGILRFTVYQVDRVKGDLTFDYEVTPVDAYISVNDTLKSKSVGETVEFLTQEKGLHIGITCNSAYVPEFVQVDDGPADTNDLPDAIQSVHHTHMSGNDIPEETELRTELPLHLVSTTRKQDGDDSPEVKPTVHVKASFDLLSNSISSKRLQLEQLQDEIDQLASAIKEVRNPPKATKSSGKGAGTKGKKGKKKSVAKEEVDEDAERDGGDDKSDSTMTTVFKYAAAGVGSAINNRAYILFGVASVVIYCFGDYASV